MKKYFCSDYFSRQKQILPWQLLTKIHYTFILFYQVTFLQKKNCYFELYQIFFITSSMVHAKYSKLYIVRNKKQYAIKKKKNIDLGLARLKRWKNPG
jgi:hypothetical protein